MVMHPLDPSTLPCIESHYPHLEIVIMSPPMQEVSLAMDQHECSCVLGQA